MLQPPIETDSPREPQYNIDVLERLLERQGALVFAHPQPYRRLLVTRRPDMENPRTGATQTDFLTMPVIGHGMGGTRLTWNELALDGLERFVPDRNEYHKAVNARAYAIGDESLDIAVIRRRMRDCIDAGGEGRLVWACADSCGAVELHLGSDSMDDPPDAAPDPAVPVGAMTMSAQRLLEAMTVYIQAQGTSPTSAFIALDVMQRELDIYCAYANGSIHTVELQSLSAADLLAGRDVAWVSDTEVQAGDAASALAVAAGMFHDRKDSVTDLVTAHIPI